ncbi:MAG: bifunctional chorismate mutase/prephenate dehydrogenase [Desulfobacula sp.]|jgi:chorismate mutase/prephenate dehydrogenase
MKKGKSAFEQEVIPLREKIDDIDSQILSLLGQRQAEVKKVVHLKKKFHVPIYHPAREEDLISKLRTEAERTGLKPDFLEELYRLILRQSRVEQTDKMVHNGLRPGSNILIIGGSGQMGIFFSSLFQKSGYLVRSLSEHDWDKAALLCKDIDLALVSVPIDKTEDVIERVAPFLSSETLLADLTSIKEKPLKKMLDSHPGPVMGLHPIFGPTSASLDKQIIVVTPGRHPDQCRWLIDQLILWGAVMVEAGAKEHDDIMAIVQALRHFATFCFGRFLYEKHIPLRKTLEFSSPIYRLELGMVGRLFAQESTLYSEIIFATNDRRLLLKEFITSLNTHVEMLENNDKALFISKFNEIAQWFGPFSEQALRESTYLINRLIERF